MRPASAQFVAPTQGRHSESWPKATIHLTAKSCNAVAVGGQDLGLSARKGTWPVTGGNFASDDSVLCGNFGLSLGHLSGDLAGSHHQ